MPHRTFVGCIALAMLAVSTAALAQTLSFASPNYDDNAFVNLRRNAAKGEAQVNARVSFPDRMSGPVPAVIVAHTSGGWRDGDDSVVRAMNRAGFAAVGYDSFVAHKIGGITGAGGGVRGLVHQVADALLALKALAADPRIDSKRVAIVGGSVGGGAAVLAASRFMKSKFLGDSPLQFAAHVAFYPGLHLAPAPDNMTGAPILFIIGDRDDSQYPDRVKWWADLVRRDNPSVRVEQRMMAGALHSFLDPSLPLRRQMTDYVNGSKCPVQIAAPRPVNVYLTSALTLQEAASREEAEKIAGNCLTRGGSIGYDGRRADEALALTVDFLKEAFAAVQ